MAVWTHVDKLGTSNFAYGLRMSKSSFALLTYCTDDPKIAVICHLGFLKIRSFSSWWDLGWNVNMCHCAKFCEDRPNYCRDMEIK